MTRQELHAAMDRLGLSRGDLACLVPGTWQAVDHWLAGRRPVSASVVTALRLAERAPAAARELIGERRAEKKYERGTTK
jgi:hypothetical protein